MTIVYMSDWSLYRWPPADSITPVDWLKTSEWPVACHGKHSKGNWIVSNAITTDLIGSAVCYTVITKLERDQVTGYA